MGVASNQAMGARRTLVSISRCSTSDAQRDATTTLIIIIIIIIIMILPSHGRGLKPGHGRS
jgi:hypothetical protein